MWKSHVAGSKTGNDSSSSFFLRFTEFFFEFQAYGKCSVWKADFLSSPLEIRRRQIHISDLASSNQRKTHLQLWGNMGL